jgi:hypothetical protein
MNAKIYKTDGTIEDIAPKNGKSFELDELYEAIGCDLVEVIAAGPGTIAICDEEGRLKDEPQRNDAATQIVTEGLTKLGRFLYGDYLVGNVIVCDTELFQ